MHNVNDFLKAADQFNKQRWGAATLPLVYHYRWWESSKYGIESWMIGTFLVVGVIWPTLLGVMIKGGLGKMTPEEYDLSRFKGGNDPATIPKPTMAPITQSEMDKLRDLEAAMAENLKAGAVAAPEQAAEKPPEAAPVVKKLAGSADEKPAPVQPVDEPKSYTGEFYPVVKSQTHPDEKK
jgi:hypothetical protein